MTASRLHAGPHQVSPSTTLYINRYKPTHVETTAYSLDYALDVASKFYGALLRRTGPWLTSDGRNPENEDTGDHSLVRCPVEEGP
jgi:hypothetical protein